MKNIYRVTRPAWAAMERVEFSMILLAGLVIGGIGLWGDLISKRFDKVTDFTSLSVLFGWK